MPFSLADLLAIPETCYSCILYVAADGWFRGGLRLLAAVTVLGTPC